VQASRHYARIRLQLSYSAAQTSRYQGDRWARWTIKPMRLEKLLTWTSRSLQLLSLPSNLRVRRAGQDMRLPDAEQPNSPKASDPARAAPSYVARPLKIKLITRKSASLLSPACV
jgi:hypothetical protein